MARVRGKHFVYFVPALAPFVSVYVAHAAVDYPLLRQAVGFLYLVCFLPLVEICYAVYLRIRPAAQPECPPPPSRSDPVRRRVSEPIPRAALVLGVHSTLFALAHATASVHASASPCATHICHVLSSAAPATPFAFALRAGSLAAFLVIGYAAAHELRHRSSASGDRFWSWLYLSLVLNPAYYADHPHHHRWVGTDIDTVSAPRGMGPFAAVVRMEAGGWLRAFRCSFASARASPSPFEMLLSDAFLRGVALAFAVVGAVAYLGRAPACMYVLSAASGAGLMDVANYMQHYGLRRTTDGTTGKLESVALRHSWDCFCPITSPLSFEVGVHAHHHLAPDVQLTGLRTGGGRTFPLGVFAMTVVALVWPLFRVIAHPILDEIKREEGGRKDEAVAERGKVREKNDPAAVRKGKAG